MLLCTHFLGRYGHETLHSPPGCIRDVFGGPEQRTRGLGVPHEFDSSEKIIFGQKFIFTRCMLPFTYGAWVRSICGPGGLLGV